LELRWGAGPRTDAGEVVRPLYAVAARAIVTGTELESATAAIDPATNAPEVRFELSPSGGRAFADVTGRNVGQHLAIVLEGRVQGQPPVIIERIGAIGRIELTGRSLQEANDLALVLRGGALPVPLRVVEQRTIGPSVGRDSIVDGVRASILAVGLVLVAMGTYYGVAGLLAVAALLLYVLYCAGGLAALGYTLTLPGLAGFALSVGMAVDANVLIFERIRDERSAGKSPRLAVKAGFEHAMSAIVDSNITTALTAVILYHAGTEAVRGFAVTLLIGLAASMVTAIFVTRTFLLLWLRRWPARVPMTPRAPWTFANGRVDFMRLRRWAVGASAIAIVPGLILIGGSGIRYNVEFTGGTLLQLRTKAPVETSALRSALASALDSRSDVDSTPGPGAPGSLAPRDGRRAAVAEIRSFGSPRDHVVRARLSAAGSDAAEVDSVRSRVRTALDSALGSGQYEIVRTESVGPSVSGELQQRALAGVLISFGTTLAYLAFRFEWRYGLAAVVATAHDILATIALIRYLDLEISLIVVAAVLTVLGYSLNDTIVIFDRVRENRLIHPRAPLREVLNRSIGETLPRTILTGGTTLGSAIILALLAGEVIRPFGLVMSFGIVAGTASSIFIAGPVLAAIAEREAPGGGA
jgi:SecD/SecF fusion protein